MEPSLAGLLTTYQSNRQLVAQVVRNSTQPGELARLLAEMLHSVWPRSPVHGCLLRDGARSQAWVVDGAGASRPEWAKALLDAFVTPHDTRKPDRVDYAALSRIFGLAAQSLECEEAATHPDGCCALVLAAADNAAAEERAAARTLLMILAQQAALELALEAAARERQASRKVSAHLTGMANRGELARPLLHEFNNYLNNIVLEMEILELELGSNRSPRLSELRRRSKAIAALLQNWQRYHPLPAPLPEPTDLNRTVRATTEMLGGKAFDDHTGQLVLPDRATGTGPTTSSCGNVSVVLDLAADLAPVLGSAPDLERLCTFLLTNAVTAAGPAKGKVGIQTAQQGDKLLLRVHDSGPEVPETLLGQLFEPGSVCRRGTNSLELAACHSLVHRLKGKIYAENDREGGVGFIVELPAAPSKSVDTLRS